MFSLREINVFAAMLEESYKDEIEEYELDKSLDMLYRLTAEKLSERGRDGLAIMQHYSELMRMEQEIYNPCDAYLAGRAAQPGCDLHKALISYLSRVMSNPMNRELLREQDCLYYMIYETLGESDSTSLLGDYTVLYRQYHGTVSRNIDFFFNLGYCSNAGTVVT